MYFVFKEQTEDEAPVTKVIVKEDGEVFEEAKKLKPDPITQLVQCFQRAATSEQKQVRRITEDKLFMDFSEVMAKSIHISEEDDDGGGDEEPTSREVYMHLHTYSMYIDAVILCVRHFQTLCKLCDRFSGTRN